MDKPTKKEIQAQYKEREVIGGVYAIRNTTKNKLLIEAAADLHGSRNRFEFAQKTGSCIHPKLQYDWAEQTADQFAFEVLDEMKKGDNQTSKQFSADIELMKQMWLEKLSGENLY